MTTDHNAQFAVGSETVHYDVLHGSEGPSVVDISTFYKDTGMFTYDPGFTSTAACESSAGTTRQIGSMLTIRAPGHVPWIASIARIAARARAFLSSNPRPRACGANRPTSPAAHEKYEGSLMGVK